MPDIVQRFYWAATLRDAAKLVGAIDRTLQQLTQQDLQQLDAAVITLVSLSRKIYQLDPER